MENNICEYSHCWLPKDNKRYGWQLAYLIVSLCILLADKKNFTFFPIFLFIAPVFLDLMSSELKTATIEAIRKIFGLYNSVLLITCILGAAGFVQADEATFFIVSTSLIFPGKAVSKEIIGYILLPDLIVPIIFWIGAPCQKAKMVLKTCQLTIHRKEEHKQ